MTMPSIATSFFRPWRPCFWRPPWICLRPPRNRRWLRKRPCRRSKRRSCGSRRSPSRRSTPVTPRRLGGMFLETGELVDEAGNVHAGKAAITELFTGFFGKFPKASLEMLVDSARPVGDTLAVEEGQRRITTADGETAQVRYVAIRSKQGDRWPIASYHEFTDDPIPTPGRSWRGRTGSWATGSTRAPRVGRRSRSAGATTATS